MYTYHSRLISSRKYGIFEEPNCTDKHRRKYHYPEFVPAILTSVQLISQHLHRAYRQESPCWYWQKYRLHEISKRGNGPSESDCQCVQQGLTNDESICYIFFDIFVSVVDAHRKSISPLMKSYGYCNTEKAPDRILHTNCDALEDGVEIHGQSQKICVLVVDLLGSICLFLSFVVNDSLFLLCWKKGWVMLFIVMMLVSCDNSGEEDGDEEANHDKQIGQGENLLVLVVSF